MSDERIRELERAWKESGSDEAGAAWVGAVLQARGLPALATAKHLFRQQDALIRIAQVTRPSEPVRPRSFTEAIMSALTHEPTPDEIVRFLCTGVLDSNIEIADSRQPNSIETDEEGHVTAYDAQGNAVPFIAHSGLPNRHYYDDDNGLALCGVAEIDLVATVEDNLPFRPVMPAVSANRVLAGISAAHAHDCSTCRDRLPSLLTTPSVCSTPGCLQLQRRPWDPYCDDHTQGTGL